ncbi:protein transport protein SEC61 subunit alpha-like [Panicum virgatum]|nr:protein transport protein SEC61 subunit alpha-like [Panicum virgatum]
MAGGSLALDLVRPLASLMPAVRRADRAVPFHRRALYTGISVSVFLVCSHLPLYGVRYAASAGADPLYWVRSILASNRGTLLELGVGPVVTGGTVIQLATASRLLRVDHNVRADRELVAAARKVLAMVIAAFSPVTVNTGRVPEFEGIVLAVVYQAVARAGSARALVATLLRRHLPNAMSLLATCVVMLAAVFLEGVQMLLPLHSRDGRGLRATFPIKLLYTSTMPIVLHSAAVTALYHVSQLLHYSRFGGGVLVRLLGVWKEGSHAAVPVGGLAYYVTPPSSVAADPLHALVYTVLLLASCALLSQAWVIASESSAEDVARQLADQRLAMPGRRDGATHSQLSRSIPTAAALGGLCVGALTIFADMTGVIGTGTGIMLAATAVYNLVNSVEKEE